MLWKQRNNKYLFFSFGKSSTGKDLWMIEFGPESGDARYVPEMLVVGSLHGDERVGYEMALVLSEHLCMNYKNDFIITSVSFRVTFV